MSDIIRAEQVKINNQEIEDKWKNILANHFNKDGSLKDESVQKVNCPLCSSSKYDDEFVINGFHHVYCTECKTLYVTPRLKDECVRELYSDQYYSELYQHSMIPAFEVRKDKIGKNKYKQITNFIQKTGKILDIGAGVGEVVDVFKDNNWDTYVTEVNPVAVEWLNSKGHTNVFHGRLDQYDCNQKFDVIMAWGVIEHVVKPQEFVKKAFNLLKPGGIFVTEVPNGNCLLVDYCKEHGKTPNRILLGEQHIVFYSVERYSYLHKTAGFKPLHIQTNGLDLSTILKMNNESISDQLLGQLQSKIDGNMYGDLLRGFWTK